MLEEEHLWIVLISYKTSYYSSSCWFMDIFCTILIYEEHFLMTHGLIQSLVGVLLILVHNLLRIQNWQSQESGKKKKRREKLCMQYNGLFSDGWWNICILFPVLWIHNCINKYLRKWYLAFDLHIPIVKRLNIWNVSITDQAI